MPRPITTERLVLRDFAATDAPAIVAAFKSRTMCNGLTVVPCPDTPGDADWFNQEGSDEALAVTRRDGELVGAVGLCQQLGCWIAMLHWGFGYATEAARAVMDRHFAQSDAAVCSGHIDDNRASAAVLRKLALQIVSDTTLHIKSRNTEVPGKHVTLSHARWSALQ